MIRERSALFRIWSCLSGVLTTMAGAGNWPGFRGPDGNGIAREDHAPLHWGPNEHILWKNPLPGPGNSSPIVLAGRVFVTCAEQQGKKRRLFCYDRKTGTTLWVRTEAIDYVEPTHPTNPYCASTPAADATHIVVWHGSAGVFCYSLEGELLWHRDVGPVRHEWGYASSPILYRGMVILNRGPGQQTFLAALNLQNGDLVWKFDEPGGLDATNKQMIGSWVTPVVAQTDGRSLVLCTMPTRVIACDAETGVLVWVCGGLADEKANLIYPAPLVANGWGMACSGWVNGPAIGFKLGGSGDITESNRLWQAQLPQQVASGIAMNGFAYVICGSPSAAQCIEIRTGKVRWTERLEGGETWGSLVAAGGRFYATHRNGVTSVFRATEDSFELLAQNDLGEASNATPAISDGQIFLRTDKHVYAVSE